MKSAKQVDRARTILAQRVQEEGLTDVQKALIVGMINSLVWVADGPNASTMERMLSGDPLAPGKDSRPAMDKLNKGLQALKSTATSNSQESSGVEKGK